MIGGARIRNGLVLLAGAVSLAACSTEIPDFLGREGDGQGFYNIRGEASADPRTLPMTEAVVERGLYGVILRVQGTAPTQGWYSAQLVPVNGGQPDASGTISFEFMAVPPADAQDVGPARTRALGAAVFVPNLSLKQIRAFRVSAAGRVETLPAPAYVRPRVPEPEPLL